MEDKEILRNAAKDFNTSVKEKQLSNNIENENIWHFDQFRVEYELCIPRTLTQSGEKDTVAKLMSLNDIMH